MDFSTLLQSLQGTLGESLPGILGALAILVVGWIVAVVIRAVLRKVLGLAQLNRRIESGTGRRLDVEGGVATGGYFVVLLMVLVAFFDALNLRLVSEPLQGLLDQLFAFAPRLVGAAVLGLVAFVLATVLRALVTNVLAATSLDEKLGAEAGMKPMSMTLGMVLFWLVILMFVPAILGTLQLNGLLEPVQGMFDKFLGMIPNLLAAAVIGIVGWFVAKILRDLVTNVLAAAGVDGLGQRVGLRESTSLSRIGGVIVYIVVLLPALVAALDALRIEAVSAPATEMLGQFMAAVPNLLAAAIIVGVAFAVARFVGGLAANLLAGIGFDEVPGKLGLGGATAGGTTPSALVGRLIVFFAVLFATVEAANRLGFTQLSRIAATFVEFGGQVLLGVVIIGVGLWIANVVGGAMGRAKGANAGMLAGLARYAILGLVLAMGLRAMGIADDIVNLAFGLTLGAVAVAVALSFGLGGRQAAGKQMEHWLSRIRGGTRSK